MHSSQEKQLLAGSLRKYVLYMGSGGRGDEGMAGDPALQHDSSETRHHAKYLLISGLPVHRDGKPFPGWSEMGEWSLLLSRGGCLL